MSLPSVALPGHKLGPISKHLPGAGTHVQSAHIHASVAGPVAETHAHAQPLTTASPAKPKPSSSSSARSAPTTLSVSSFPSLASANAPSPPLPSPAVLPDVGSTVLARVTRLTHRQAGIEILVVDDRVCRDGWAAIVRAQDVRATEKDKVKVGECFRVGDVVRGVVISLGDQAAYYVSTASNELGVVLATSVAGNQMYPISWREFRDPETGLTEVRKVAKPF